MVKELGRLRRIAQGIQEEIALIPQRGIKNPRLDMATIIPSVGMSRDLTYVRVYVMFLNDKDEDTIKAGVEALQGASGLTHNLLGETVRPRTVPELTFFYDNSLIEGIRMSSLVTSVVKHDEEHRVDPDDNKED